MTARLCPQSEQDAWPESRRGGLGGTDAADIARGFWAKVWLKKVFGIEDPASDDTASEFGLFAEPFIAGRYEKETGRRLSKIGMIYDKKRRWMRGTPDRLVGWEVDDEEALFYVTSEDGFSARGPFAGGVELKKPTRHSRREWNPIPVKHLIQCQWYLAITGAPWWDLVWMFDSDPIQIHRVLPDLELQRKLIVACGRFWKRHVLTREEPPTDDPSQALQIVQKTIEHRGGPMVRADEQTQDLARETILAASKLSKAETAWTWCMVRMLRVIGPNDGVYGKLPGVGSWKATWKPNAAGRRTAGGILRRKKG